MYIIDDNQKIVKVDFTKEQFESVMQHVLNQMEQAAPAAVCSISITNHTQYSFDLTIEYPDEKRTFSVGGYSDTIYGNIPCGGKMTLKLENSDARVEFNSLITVAGEEYEGLGVTYDLTAPENAGGLACITIM